MRITSVSITLNNFIFLLILTFNLLKYVFLEYHRTETSGHLTNPLPPDSFGSRQLQTFNHSAVRGGIASRSNGEYFEFKYLFIVVSQSIPPNQPLINF